MNERTTVAVNIRKGYGVARIYPANDAARTLAALTRNKTLLPEDLQNARALGMDVTITYDADCMALAAHALRSTTGA